MSLLRMNRMKKKSKTWAFISALLSFDVVLFFFFWSYRAQYTVNRCYIDNVSDFLYQSFRILISKGYFSRITWWWCTFSMEIPKLLIRKLQTYPFQKYWEMKKSGNYTEKNGLNKNVRQISVAWLMIRIGIPSQTEFGRSINWFIYKSGKVGNDSTSLISVIQCVGQLISSEKERWNE